HCRPPRLRPLVPYPTLCRSFEYQEKQSVGMTLMLLRPENVETVLHPEAETEEQAAELVARLRAEGQALFAGDRILLDVPFRDKEDRKSTRLNSSHVKISYAV